MTTATKNEVRNVNITGPTMLKFEDGTTMLITPKQVEPVKQDKDTTPCKSQAIKPKPKSEAKPKSKGNFKFRGKSMFDDEPSKFGTSESQWLGLADYDCANGVQTLAIIEEGNGKLTLGFINEDSQGCEYVPENRTFKTKDDNPKILDRTYF